MVAVITDSCASIPTNLVEALQITVVPYYIHEQGRTLRDLVDVTAEEFFRRLPQARTLPTTANPSPGDYLAAFRRAAARGQEIVSIHMTSKGSGAYQAALVAKEMAADELPEAEIEVVDTLQVALSHGWAAIEAARAAQAGADLEAVVEMARRVAGANTMIQTADTLKYLYLGGRIGRAQHLVGSLLNIKPLIGMEEGVIVPLGKARSRARAYQAMVGMMGEGLPAGAAIKLAVMHTAAPAEAQRMRQMVEARFQCQETIIAQLSPALGVHTGPGLVGVSYFPV
ncbi:MAG: DegV family protein [Anaerolineae bacterium]